jgi:hypothetical protein
MPVGASDDDIGPLITCDCIQTRRIVGRRERRNGLSRDSISLQPAHDVFEVSVSCHSRLQSNFADGDVICIPQERQGVEDSTPAFAHVLPANKHPLEADLSRGRRDNKSGAPELHHQITDVYVTRRVENRRTTVDADDHEVGTPRLVRQIIRKRCERYRRAPFEASAVLQQGRTKFGLGVLYFSFAALWRNRHQFGDSARENRAL